MPSPNKPSSSKPDIVAYLDRLLADHGITDEMLSEQKIGSPFPVNGIPLEVGSSLFDGLEHLVDDQRIPAGDDESIVLVRAPSGHTYKIYFTKGEDGKFSAYAFQPISEEKLAKESKEVVTIRDFMGDLF